jgi:hypothetical protein
MLLGSGCILKSYPAAKAQILLCWCSSRANYKTAPIRARPKGIPSPSPIASDFESGEFALTEGVVKRGMRVEAIFEVIVEFVGVPGEN